MQNSFVTFLLNVSRPRFWLYVLGPYLVGLVAGAVRTEDLIRWDTLMFGLFFLLPANLLIYGINDVFDFETDRRNPKKAEYELLVRPESHRPLLRWIAILNIPFVVAAYFLAPHALPSLAGFIFFSVFYSAPPIRAKAIPIVDSAFNILYVFPAAFAYQMITGEFPPLIVFTSAWLWTIAMHAYSAIPDIAADRSAKVKTLATLLDKNATLFFCLIAYIASAVLAWRYLGFLSLIIGIVYTFMIAISFIVKNDNAIFAIYKYFPLLNAAIGFVLFWSIALAKFV